MEIDVHVRATGTVLLEGFKAITMPITAQSIQAYLRDMDVNFSLTTI